MNTATKVFIFYILLLLGLSLSLHTSLHANNIVALRLRESTLMSSSKHLLQTSPRSKQQISQLMKVDQESIKTPDLPQEQFTPCLTWIDTKVNLKGLLLCIHGLGLHKGSFQEFGEQMAPLGWGVYAVDVRGLGSFLEMPGQRNLDINGCVTDVYQALIFMHKLHPQVPVFLLGESMGGAIALRVTSLYPDLVDGLISSVPSGERFHQTRDSVKVGMALITSPHKTMNVASIVVDRSTVKSALREQWLKDPLARLDFTPRELIQFQRFMDDNRQVARKITKTPVLMLQGCKDTLVKKEGNESIINEIPSQDSLLVFVDGGEHLIFQEGQFDSHLLDTICGWLSNHVPVKQQTGSGLQ